ncbi:glycoside hydrolase family 3 protein [Permianibacter aggregans]|uniref:Exo-1,4-beta-glucosidase n=1 Tax=Permianibacter aggregans TaxID=1510150 RepID=A0A4R6UVC5_9GAMM|nr:exo 1,3/1,4-beta-D-glucan glucohydrolase [Permianibacter aggregans]TDQ51338.1 exo-1,4-beta-glucosidase [Permianibacter aggregans]
MKKNLISATLPCLLLALTACDRSGEQSEKRQAVSETSSQLNVPDYWPKRQAPVNTALEARIQALMATMTTEQKVAQIIQPEIRDITVEDMRRYGFGSYLNGGGAYPNNNKHTSIDDWVLLAEQMYQASIDDSLDGSRIPTMWGTDAVHGHNNVIGATLFPHNVALGATHNPELIKRIAEITATEVAVTGIDWVFAPTVAVARDVRWGRAYESYSENPELVAHYAKAFVHGMQGQGETLFDQQHVISTLKHFIGDGGTVGGDDQGDVRVDEQQLFALHAQGYITGIEAGAQTIMASFNSWQGEKLHGHQYLLTEVLKNRLGFDGLVVGDWNGHGQIPGCSNEHCPQAFNAGVDIFMVPGDSWRALYDNTLADVKNGVISMERLDDAVSRILRVKIRAGLFDKPSPAQRALAGKKEKIGDSEHRAIARQAVRESLVLLKNRNQLLPLDPSKRFLVAGDGADNIGKQAGGWTITWQGTGNQNSDFPGATSIYQGLKNAIDKAGGQIELNVAGNFTQKPDVAIVVFGEEPYAEGNGDLDNLEYQRGNKTDLALLQKLQAQGIPVVSIFLSGRPMWINAELNASDAFVAAWLPGSEGAGIADVILRNTNGDIAFDFTGRLPFSWPATPAPATGKPETTLLAYGAGLKYGADELLSAKLPIESETASDQLPPVTLLAQSVKAPWRIDIGSPDQLITNTSNVQSAGPVSIRTIDKTLQEDARLLQFSGESIGMFALRADFPVDWRGYLDQHSALVFSVNPTKLGDKPLHLITACGEKCLASIDLHDTMQALPVDTWSQISVDLQCLREQGMNFGQTFVPFSLQTGSATVFSIADVKIEPGKAKTATIRCAE